MRGKEEDKMEQEERREKWEDSDKKEVFKK